MTVEFQSTIPYFSAIPTDVVTNTLHFNWIGVGDPDASDYTALASDVEDLLEDIYVTNISMAPWARPTAWRYKVYDLDDPEPRVPVASGGPIVLDVTQASTSTTVPETAICLSFQGDPVSGENQASRRGRIFLGALAIAVTAGSSSVFPNVGSSVRTQIGTAAAAFAAATFADGWAWVVLSRKLSTTTLVTNGWVDDAPDTQRRRGQAASVRSLWSA